MTAAATNAARRRWAVVAIIAALAAIFYASGAAEVLSIAGVKARLSQAQAFHAERPLATVALFMGVQVTALALCLPGAVLAMALAGGALFGPGLGLLVVLCSVTIGDSLGFLLARHALGDLLGRSHRALVERIGTGSGAAYLLALRMMAVVPYFVVNIAMAMTPMKLRVFAPVSFLGLIPSTLLYVSAGAALGQIRSGADIWTPPMVLTFLVLGLFPLAARWAYRRFYERRGS